MIAEQHNSQLHRARYFLFFDLCHREDDENMAQGNHVKWTDQIPD